MPTTRSQGLTASKVSKNTKMPRTRKRKIDKTANVTEASQTHLPSSFAESPFFKLSAELRNMIYRFAIVTQEQVQITKSGGIPEPALLSVNKTVRSEALGIFYLENEFSAVVEEYDPATVLLALRRWSAFGVATGPIGICRLVLPTLQDPNWNNLVQWLHLCLRQKCVGFGLVDYDDAELKLVAGLFGAVIDSHDMSAGTLDILLKNMRPALVELDEDWAKD